MVRRLPIVMVLILAVVSLGITLNTASAQEGMFTIQSQPDAAALYQGDMAYIRDEVTIPASTETHIVLPASTVPNSLIILEGDARIQSYRYRSSVADPTISVLSSSVPSPNAPIVTLSAVDGDAPRTITLTYLAYGAGWEPLYDMDVQSPELVQFGFDALVTNRGLHLQDADVRLVAGMPGADPNYRPDMTVTQMNVLYEEPTPSGISAGAVAINHVYDLGTLTLLPGETLRWNMAYAPLDARRLIVWDARFGQRTDVIYKITNDTDVPFVAGPVSAFEDGLYVGTDNIELTPIGSEGSITIGGLSNVRVRKTESVEDIGSFSNSRYLHTVNLAITNHSAEDLELIVLDEWNRSGLDFIFNIEPIRQGNNVLRWEVTIPAGEQLNIDYTYIID